MKKLFALLIFCLAANVVNAEQAQSLEDADPMFEERFRSLASELRCQKCQNQSIYDSKAGLADDLKRQIRDQMHQGKSDEQIVEYLVNRYGDFIRYRPEINAKTVLLWVGPFILLLIGISMLFIQLKKRRRLITDTPLSADEVREVETFMKNRDGDK